MNIKPKAPIVASARITGRDVKIRFIFSSLTGCSFVRPKVPRSGRRARNCTRVGVFRLRALSHRSEPLVVPRPAISHTSAW